MFNERLTWRIVENGRKPLKIVEQENTITQSLLKRERERDWEKDSLLKSFEENGLANRGQLEDGRFPGERAADKTVLGSSTPQDLHKSR